MDEVKLRRYSTSLTISGYGVIAFGLWSIVKTILLSVMHPEVAGILPDEETGISRDVYIALMICIMVLLLGFDLGLRIYIGLSARAEGNGKKKHITYLVFAAFLLTASLLSLLTGLDIDDYDSILDFLVSLLVEITSMAAVLELIYSSVRVRLLRKKLEREAMA